MFSSKWTIPVILVLWASGCEESLSWQKKQVPITPAKEQVALATPAPSPAASAPASAPVQTPKPAPAAVVATTGPAASQPVVLAPPKQIERPISLTDLVTDGGAVSQPASVPADFTPAALAATTQSASLRPALATQPAPGASPLPNGSPMPRAQVVATYGLQVNDRYITIEEILRSAAGDFAEMPKNLEEEAFRRQARRIIQEEIRSQVRNALVFREAEARMADEQKKIIDSEMDKTLSAMVTEAGGSRKKLEAVQIQRGTTLEEVLREQRRKLTVALYLQSKFYPAIVINRDMMLAYYRKNKATRFTAVKKVQMQVIAAPLSAFGATARSLDAQIASAKADARKQIEAAQQALAAGEDFGEVAKKLSKAPNADTGGLYSLMEAGSFKEAKVEAAAFALDQGQVSDIIETDTGFYIVKAKVVQPGGDISFEKAQEEIEKALHREQYDKLQEEYMMTKAEAASITTSDRLEENALEKAVERYWKK